MLHEYPQHADNPAPYGQDAAAWCTWAESLPIMRDLGVRVSAFGPEGTTLVLDKSPFVPNPNGSVHGAVVAAVADCAFGVVFFTAIEPHHLPATANLSVEYHRPAFAPLTFATRVTSRGRSLVFCHADITDRDGKLCAVAHGTMAIRATPVADSANER